MTNNLLDSLKEYITPETLTKLSSSVGESEGGISKALGAIFPTILGGIIDKADDSTFLNKIINLGKDNADSLREASDNPAAVLDDSAKAQGADSLGKKFLQMIFGGRLSDITDSLSNFAGLKNTSIGSLLTLAAPLVLGQLSKGNTSATSLASSLLSQKDAILGAVPGGLSTLLGGVTGAISGGARQAAEKVNVPPITSAEGGSSSSGSWRMPVIIGILLLLAGWYFLKNCSNKPTDSELGTGDSLTEMTSDTVASDVGVGELGAITSLELPGGATIDAPSMGVEAKFLEWLKDDSKVVDKTTWFNFDRLLFDTGKATLTTESQDQLTSVAAILKAYPNVNLKIGGYTDNTGSADLNLKLSGERATNVQNELVTMGVDKSRLEAEGYGQEQPVASNDTEEGRGQNRRIAFRVTKK